ncbi:hypothetical protein B0H34DRAFT_810700 [Crassisporium funariophilum]|nr:hypothetical protein B0H34DRAFT_810700 [Crassisporium funariophilum]
MLEDGVRERLRRKMLDKCKTQEVSDPQIAAMVHTHEGTTLNAPLPPSFNQASYNTPTGNTSVDLSAFLTTPTATYDENTPPLERGNASQGSRETPGPDFPEDSTCVTKTKTTCERQRLSKDIPNPAVWASCCAVFWRMNSGDLLDLPYSGSVLRFAGGGLNLVLVRKEFEASG